MAITHSDPGINHNTTGPHHTWMDDIAGLRIHVAPVGFEVDRVVVPAIQRKADKVWLMVSETPDRAQIFHNQIQDKLKECAIDMVTKSHDRKDLFDIIRATREIIQTETKNNVFVNLSSGSKIQAVGCMMACMMFNSRGNVHPYYVEPAQYMAREENEAISQGVHSIMDMPQYQIPIPNDTLIGAMNIIRQGRIKKKQLMSRLIQEGLLRTGDDAVPSDGRTDLYDAQSRGALASMNTHIIRPLEERRFIKVEKIGRNRWISLTEDGINASTFLLGYKS